MNASSSDIRAPALADPGHLSTVMDIRFSNQAMSVVWLAAKELQIDVLRGLSSWQEGT